MGSGWKDKWSEEELTILREKYPVNGVDKVMGYLPTRSRKAILSMAGKHKIKQWSYNENYFEKIDNEQKAYWLGFIYADGYISTTNLFGIELCIEDLNHLKKFKQDIDSNMNIRVRKKVTYGKERESCIIEFRNQKIVSDLIKQGINTQKSYNVEVPHINENLVPSFIRGFFDGDGTYVLGKGYNKEVSCICTCENFLKWIKEDFDKNGIESHLGKTSKKNLYILRIYKNESLQKYYNTYWKDATIYLDRKKEKIEKIYNYCLLHSK